MELNGHKWKPILNGMSYILDEGNTLTIFNGEKHYDFNGASVEDITMVVGEVNGIHTIEEIAEITSLPENYIFEILELLNSKGIIRFDNLINNIELNDDENIQLQNLLSAFSHSKGTSIEIINSLIKKRVNLSGNKKLTKYLKESLSKKFLIDETPSSDTNLIVGIEYGENVDFFKEKSTRAKGLNIPFLKIVVTNSNVTIGPLFIPGETACYSCYLTRLYTNMSNPKKELLLRERFYESRENLQDLQMVWGGISTSVSLTTTFITKYFSNKYPCEIVNQEYSFSFESMESTFSTLLRVPGCPVCEKNKVYATSKKDTTEAYV
ncbi:TOMM precursor leader peptide-binding protein [Rossellomorea vietnamensis]|uniref:TOMM precursor leader peptide-binding protein n=1 Tax=Rossellomorea vietnamensis TaxID=218284 RepID=UPI00077CA1E6|nr:TOMM precursor leader peptide-binding protein [Rossellomorea vietnamensis]